jgi:hypothetical protein
MNEAFGKFKAVAKQGEGDSVVRLPAKADVALVAATHNGSANFVIETMDSSNEQVELLVNTIGDYAGTTLCSEGNPKKLKITADGTWTIKLKPVSKAKRLHTATKGVGDTVLVYGGPAADFAIKHKGESNFVVETIGAEGNDLLVNEIGSYSGTVPVAAGPMVIKVTADGTWSIKTL